MEHRELVILGAGPAGLTAAIYARRAGLDTLVLEHGIAGGQINITDEIENWPGTLHTSGAALGESLRDHALHFGAEIRDCEVQRVKCEANKTIITDAGEIEADAIILATGAHFSTLGCPGEREFTGAGVSYCAVCDGAFFEGTEIAVVGGGNVAVEEAVYLTNFADKVYLIHRRDKWRAVDAACKRALANEKIVPIWDTVVEAIEGSDFVEKVKLKNVKTGEKSELSVSGCFIFVGVKPNVSYLGEENLIVKQSGWIVTNEKMETSVPGIFAAGDIRDKFLRQVVTAAADGAVAAMAAYSYIREK